MTIDIKLSSKGQIVIPKDVRDALQLGTGSMLRLSQVGQQIILEVPGAETKRSKISYDEFRRRMPLHVGPPATLDEMRAAVDEMFSKRGRP